MAIAKVVSLNVTPFQASHLCFEVGGILGECNIELGTRVKAFDFAGFYATLGSMPPVPGHPARLIYDFLEIQAAVKPFTLVALRSEVGKAALSKAINSRANAYYAKYANAPAIISRMNNDFSSGIIGSKANRLDILSSISQQQMEKLRDAYLTDGRTEVVKTTESSINSSMDSSASSTATGRTDQKSITQAVSPTTFTAPPPPNTLKSVTFTGNDKVNEDYQMGASFQDSTTRGSVTERQKIVNTDYGYRIPFMENLAQYERAQISLIDEQFAQFMFGQNLPYLAAVFQNELSSIDSDVYRLQIAYLNTILMSPIQGTVTGLYKNPGDAVRPGEPVVRVENDATVLFVATLIYRGPISIGSNVTVETMLFDSTGPSTKVAGSVVAVRGQGEDDRWEVVVKCNNLDASSNAIFPLGYSFDYDDTQVSIS